MQMVPVNSSNLSSVGYENGVLYVSFHHGGLYAYDGVPPHVHRELMAAASHGQYLARYVKGVYPYRKIG